MAMTEETLTDKEFCRVWKIDRATSLRWREQGIVHYIKFPNGGIRYLQSHMDELRERFEKLATLKNPNSAVKGGVVNIGVAKRGNNGSMAQDA